MNVVYYKFTAAWLIFMVSAGAVIYPLVKKYRTDNIANTLELGEAFASGVFLGVALFHMLPVARESFALIWPTLQYPVSELICGIGFMCLLFIERCSLTKAGCRHAVSLPYLFALMLAVHSLLEGSLLGLTTDIPTVTMIFIAIIAHKGSASFALCVTLIKQNLKMFHVVLIMAMFALVTPIGILCGSLVNQLAKSNLLIAIFNAGAAGSFLYMATLHHVQFHQRTTERVQNWLEFILLVFGLISMAVVAIWI